MMLFALGILAIAAAAWLTYLMYWRWSAMRPDDDFGHACAAYTFLVFALPGVFLAFQATMP